MIDEQTERELQIYRSRSLSKKRLGLAEGSLYSRLSMELGGITYLSIPPTAPYSILGTTKISRKYSILKIEFNSHNQDGVLVENE